jgi:two-component system OmpR family response regulator
MSQLIMIIDDEAGMRDLLGDALKLAGFETVTAADAMIAQTLLRTTKPDLLIVDINMPLMDGFEFIERIRGNGDNTPALMLSARGDRADITKGLTLGADDYVTKPFNWDELIARINSALRRSQQTSAAKPNRIRFGEIIIDLLSHRIWLKDKEINLSPREFSMLRLFMENPKRIYSRDDLIEKVWGLDFEGDTKTVDVHICWLRQKLEQDSNHPKIIQTVRGFGYKLGS